MLTKVKTNKSSKLITGKTKKKKLAWETKIDVSCHLASWGSVQSLAPSHIFCFTHLTDEQTTSVSTTVQKQQKKLKEDRRGRKNS